MDKNIRKGRGYWTTDEVVIKELRTVIKNINHFPTGTELREIGRSDLDTAISDHGGYNKFREVFGCEYNHCPKRYHTDENIVVELKNIINKIHRYPTNKDFRSIGRTDLDNAIRNHGGSLKFRRLVGHELNCKPPNYWTFENTIAEASKISKELPDFPTSNYLRAMGRSDLDSAILKHGGFFEFRKLLGYNNLVRPVRYWNFDNTVKELKDVVCLLGGFPSITELVGMKRTDLIRALYIFGGVNVFRKTLGYSVSLDDEYISERASYVAKRGYGTEKIVLPLLKDWCKEHDFPEPILNKKFSSGNVVEFLCGIGKHIAIDVTNTKDRYGNCIRNKYRHKNYHDYVDELWIVVFSDLITDDKYRLFSQSPRSTTSGACPVRDMGNRLTRRHKEKICKR